MLNPHAKRTKKSIAYSTLSEALLAAPAEKLFICRWIDDDEVHQVTFGEFKQKVFACARTLEKMGLRDGDRVILIMDQGIPLMVAFMAAIFLGAAPAILAYPNFKLNAEKYRDGIASVAGNLKARLILHDYRLPDDICSLLADCGQARLVSDCLFADCKPETPWSPNVVPEQLAFIQHSSGTSGLQKGVAVSHGALLRQLECLATALEITDSDSVYSWLPLYHDMGLVACFLLPMVYHLTLVLQSPEEWTLKPLVMLELMTRYSTTLAWLPNFAYSHVASRFASRQISCDLSKLRALISCSEPIRAASMDLFLKTFSTFGLPENALLTSYAMAETIFAVTQSPCDKRPVRVYVDRKQLAENGSAVVVSAADPLAACYVSSGAALPGASLRIVSESGEELPEGRAGEILVSSDYMCSGYYNRPDLDAQAFKDGWYHSGDLGFLTKEQLFVIGRIKDMIIVAGQNIYPEDIEFTLSGHPSLVPGRSVAFGLYNPKLGTEEIVVVAEVAQEQCLPPPSQLADELRSLIMQSLGLAVRHVYLKPPRWTVKSSAGKLARSAVRQKLMREHEELIYG